MLVHQTAVHALIDGHCCYSLQSKSVSSVTECHHKRDFLTHKWLCLLTERYQLSVVRWQRHRVHTLGRGRWRWQLCDRRVCVHWREWRLAKSWLWNFVAWSPVSYPPTKSVLVQWNVKILSAQLFCCCWVSVTHHVWKFTIFCLSLAGNKPFISYEVVCPSTWVKFGHGCYNFEPVMQRLTFEEAREHCRQKGREWFWLFVTCEIINYLISLLFFVKWQWHFFIIIKEFNELYHSDLQDGIAYILPL